MIGPREVFTMTALGFICASAAASNRFDVSAVSGRCKETMSLVASRSGSVRQPG